MPRPGVTDEQADMTDLLTAAQMRAIEKTAIESGHATGIELMERAGRGVVEAIFEEWPELRATSLRAVVLCGPGNNGGDGFVVARLLKEWGWEVQVFLYGDPEKLPPDARANYARWQALGMTNSLSMPAPTRAEIDRLGQAAGRTAQGDPPAIVLDALFGTGLTRPISSLATAPSELQIDAPAVPDPSSPRIVAVDIPSGLCSDSGRILDGDGETAIGAHLTVTFHARKLAHALAEGPGRCGQVVVKSIGLGALDMASSRGVPSTDDPSGTSRPDIVELQDKDELPAKTGKNAAGHKYHHGHAVILSGGPGKGGAARLAARGALRIGAGLVTVACPPAALQENAARLDAIMLRPVKDASALADFLEDTRLNAICLGPGLGTGDATTELVAVALGHPPGTQRTADPGPEPRPLGALSAIPTLGGGARLAAAPAESPDRAVTLDADALTAFAEDPETLFSLIHPNCVLTPHAGEFARLFPDIAEKLKAPASKGPAYSKVDATRDAARRAGCTVLFKGPDTVIADETGAARINAAYYDRAAPWLATAGAGDVLAGMITGLLARGLPPLEAASTAAWLHVECALSFGPGLIAEDLPEALPNVFRSLGL